MSEEAEDLIRKALVVDPKNRISAEEFVKHPWFDRLGLRYREEDPSKDRELTSRSKDPDEILDKSSISQISTTRKPVDEKIIYNPAQHLAKDDDKTSMKPVFQNYPTSYSLPMKTGDENSSTAGRPGSEGFSKVQKEIKSNLDSRSASNQAKRTKTISPSPMLESHLSKTISEDGEGQLNYGKVQTVSTTIYSSSKQPEHIQSPQNPIIQQEHAQEGPQDSPRPISIRRVITGQTITHINPANSYSNSHSRVVSENISPIGKDLSFQQIFLRTEGAKTNHEIQPSKEQEVSSNQIEDSKASPQQETKEIKLSVGQLKISPIQLPASQLPQQSRFFQSAQYSSDSMTNSPEKTQSHVHATFGEEINSPSSSSRAQKLRNEIKKVVNQEPSNFAKYTPKQEREEPVSPIYHSGGHKKANLDRSIQDNQLLRVGPDGSLIPTQAVSPIHVKKTGIVKKDPHSTIQSSDEFQNQTSYSLPRSIHNIHSRTFGNDSRHIPHFMNSSQVDISLSGLSQKDFSSKNVHSLKNKGTKSREYSPLCTAPGQRFPNQSPGFLANVVTKAQIHGSVELKSKDSVEKSDLAKKKDKVERVEITASAGQVMPSDISVQKPILSQTTLCNLLKETPTFDKSRGETPPISKKNIYKNKTNAASGYRSLLGRQPSSSMERTRGYSGNFTEGIIKGQNSGVEYSKFFASGQPISSQVNPINSSSVSTSFPSSNIFASPPAQLLVSSQQKNEASLSSVPSPKPEPADQISQSQGPKSETTLLQAKMKETQEENLRLKAKLHSINYENIKLKQQMESMNLNLSQNSMSSGITFENQVLSKKINDMIQKLSNSFKISAILNSNQSLNGNLNNLATLIDTVCENIKTGKDVNNDPRFEIKDSTSNQLDKEKFKAMKDLEKYRNICLEFCTSCCSFAQKLEKPKRKVRSPTQAGKTVSCEEGLDYFMEKILKFGNSLEQIEKTAAESFSPKKPQPKYTKTQSPSIHLLTSPGNSSKTQTIPAQASQYSSAPSNHRSSSHPHSSLSRVNPPSSGVPVLYRAGEERVFPHPPGQPESSPAPQREPLPTHTSLFAQAANDLQRGSHSGLTGPGNRTVMQAKAQSSMPQTMLSTGRSNNNWSGHSGHSSNI